jgi:hypothetical protein
MVARTSEAEFEQLQEVVKGDGRDGSAKQTQLRGGIITGDKVS